MAVRFDSATDRYTSADGPVPGAGNTFTVTWWARLASDRDNYQTFWSVDGSSYMQVCTGPDGVTPGAYAGSFGSITSSAGAMTVGAWYRMALTCDAANDVTELYVGSGAGGSLVKTSSDEVGEGGGTDPALFIGGSGSFSAEWLDGSVANFKQYSAVLSEAEIEAELASYSAVRTSGLVRHHKLQVAELTDYSGNSRSLTAGSTSATTDADGPPIADGTTGALATTLPLPTGALTGTVRTDGAGAAALPLPAVALSGQVRASGALAVTLPSSTVALAGDVRTAGALASVLPTPQPALAGDVRAAGILATVLPPPTVAITAQAHVPGALASLLPPTALALAGDLRVAGVVATTLPAVLVHLTDRAPPPRVRAGTPVAARPARAGPVLVAAGVRAGTPTDT